MLKEGGKVSLQPEKLTSFASHALYHAMSLLGMFNCGNVNYKGYTMAVHDHSGRKTVSHLMLARDEKYDPNKHGELKNWHEEGNDLQWDNRAKHVHPGPGVTIHGTSGDIEYQWKK